MANFVRRLSQNILGPKKPLVSGEEMARLPAISTAPTDIDFTEQQMESIRAIFNKFDKDGNETIDIDELEDMMNSLGLEVTHKQDDLLKVVDRDNDDTISWLEFLELIKALYRRGIMGAKGTTDRAALEADEKELAAQDAREAEEAQRFRIAKIEEAATFAQRRYLLVCVICLYFTTYIGVGMMPVLADEFRRDPGLSEVELGLLPMMYMAGFSSFTFLVAIVATRVGSTGQWMLFWLVSNALSNFLTGYATSFAGLMACRFATGASNCIFGIFVFPLIYALEPHNPLLWSGIANSMVPLALGAGYTGAGVLLQYSGVGYKELFRLLGIIIFLNAICILGGYQGFRAIDASKTVQTHKKPNYKSALRRLYCNGFNIVIATVAFQFYFVTSAIQYWIVIYYIDVVGFSQRDAGLVSGAFMVLAAFVGSLGAAVVMSKLKAGIHGTVILFAVLAVTCAGTLVFMGNFSKPRWVIFLMTVLSVSTVTAHLPSINEMPMLVLPPQYQDFGSSRLSLIQGIGGSLGPAVSGILVEAFSLQTMFQLMACSAAITVGACIVGYRIYPTDTERQQEREEIFKSWNTLLRHIGRENNSLITCDHNAHVSYARYMRMAQVFTPRAGGGSGGGGGRASMSPARSSETLPNSGSSSRPLQPAESP